MLKLSVAAHAHNKQSKAKNAAQPNACYVQCHLLTKHEVPPSQKYCRSPDWLPGDLLANKPSTDVFSRWPVSSWNFLFCFRNAGNSGKFCGNRNQKINLCFKVQKAKNVFNRFLSPSPKCHRHQMDSLSVADRPSCWLRPRSSGVRQITERSRTHPGARPLNPRSPWRRPNRVPVSTV